MRRIVAVCSAICLLLLSGTAALAAPTPPANDTPAGATTLSAGVPVEFDSTDATTETPPDPTTCDGSHGEFPGPYFASVWFKFTPTRNGIVFVDPSTIQGHPKDFVAISFLFVTTPSGLQELDCTAFGNELSWLATGGTTYLIMEAGLSSDVTGEPGLSDRGGHGTITAFQVPGRSLTRTFSNESEFSLGCSNADLTEHASVRDIVTIQFDADGSIARFIDDVNFVGVITNNDTGETFRDPGHITNIFDTSTATFRQIGLVFAITIPGRGVVALDAGKITFFPDGSVEVRGPHEVFDGLDLCDVLG